MSRHRAYHAFRAGSGRLRARRPWHGVRILGYHRVSIHPDDLSVHPHAFRRQLEQVAACEAEVVPLARGLGILEAGPVEGRYVCITFDDGYRDLQDEAYSALREFGFAATVFVSTAIVDGSAAFYWYRHPPEALSWDDLTELERGGLIDVQSQTRTHPWLPSLPETDAATEIQGSKAELEARLAHPVTTMSFPAGLAGKRELTLVEQAGYRAAVSMDAGVNVAPKSRFRLRRTMVYRPDSDRLFALKLAGALDRPSIPYRIRQLRRRRRTAPGYPAHA